METLSQLRETTDCYQRTVLPNGIRIVSEYMPYIRSITIGVWVLSGTRFEPIDKSGIAHFVEHALFKGTENRTAYQIAQSIESLGGYLNAFTGRELNCFFARVMDNNLSAAVEVLGDILQYSRFDSQEIEKEKMVVIEEIHALEDSPEELCSELYSSLIWNSHPLGKPILGSPSSISAFEQKDLVEYLRQRYTSQNIFVTVAGHVNHDELVELVRNQYNFPRQNTNKNLDLIPTTSSGNKRKWVQSRDISQVHLCLGGLSVPCTSTSKYTLFLLNGILGGGMTSRLFQKVREEAGLAYSIFSDVDLYLDSGQLCISAGVDPADPQHTIDLILQECRMLQKNGITKDELKDIRSQLTGSLYLSIEETGSVMNRLARMEIYENSYCSISDTIKRLQNVTIDDIIELAEKLFADDNIYLTAVGPISEGDLSL